MIQWETVVSSFIMKIVFLDVDGVIKPCNSVTPISGINAVCAYNLKMLLEKTGAKIVLSTSWRTNKRDLSFLEYLLDKHDIDTNLIVGSTPQLAHVRHNDSDDFFDEKAWIGSRGHEIEKFIESNLIDIDRFVILDDDNSPSFKIWGRIDGLFIKTDFDVGLDEEKTKQAIDFLNK